MGLHVFVFLLVVFLILTSFASLARFPGSIFGLPPQEGGPRAARSTVCSSPAAQMIAPPVVSPPLPRRLLSRRLGLCVPGERSKAGEEHPSG
jgi:hypothetical protein